MDHVEGEGMTEQVQPCRAHVYWVEHRLPSISICRKCGRVEYTWREKRYAVGPKGSYEI